MDPYRLHMLSYALFSNLNKQRHSKGQDSLLTFWVLACFHSNTSVYLFCIPISRTLLHDSIICGLDHCISLLTCSLASNLLFLSSSCILNLWPWLSLYFMTILLANYDNPHFSVFVCESLHRLVPSKLLKLILSLLCMESLLQVLFTYTLNTLWIFPVLCHPNPFPWKHLLLIFMCMYQNEVPVLFLPLCQPTMISYCLRYFQQLLPTPHICSLCIYASFLKVDCR